MERGTKRKAAALATASSPSSETRSPKLLKTSKGPATPKQADGETPESTSEAGLQFIAHLKHLKDKNDRLITPAFVDLPSKKELPDYYNVIALPMSINMVERKLKRKEYTDLSAVESDMKRLVANAKQYNEPRSEIFDDAERLRKAIYNWMKEHNPAYKSGKYQAVPTPVPEKDKKGAAAPSPPSPPPAKSSSGPKLKLTSSKSAAVEASPKTGTRLVLKTKKDVKSPKSASPSPQPEVQAEKSRSEKSRAEKPRSPSPQPEAKPTAKTTKATAAAAASTSKEKEVDEIAKQYKDLSFQEAQQQILETCMHYTDPGGDLLAFTPFVALPPKTLTDYYHIIQNPTSLSTVMNKTRGFHGKAGKTGVTDLKSWDAFESEVRRIWTNAREYNEDESEMFQLAGEFETFFKKQLAAAKKMVQEPPQPTLKLNVAGAQSQGQAQSNGPAGLKLRLGNNQKISPGPPSATSSAATAALDSSKAGAETMTNGVAARPGSARPGSSGAPLASPLTNGIKAEAPSRADSTGAGSEKPSSSNGAGPALQSSTHSMPPPSSRPNSGSPHPSNGITTASSAVHPHVPYHAPPTGFESKWRRAGTDAAGALLRGIRITTHPTLSSPDHVDVTVNPDPKLAKYSATFTASLANSTLQLVPTLASSLATTPASTGRPYKLFVTVNGIRAHPNPSTYPAPAPRNAIPYGNGNHQGPLVNGTGTGPNGQNAEAQLQKPPELVFDCRMVTGVNRIEIEIVTVAAAGSSELEMERCSIFPFLKRI